MGPIDTLGREIHVGDWFAYPCRSGSNCWLQVIEVKKIDGRMRLSCKYHTSHLLVEVLS